VFFEFPYVKLIDYEDRWEELEASRNPFALVTMAHLKTKATRKDPQARKEWKFWLTRRLYEQGYARQDILNLYRFLDWILELPEDFKQAFRSELAQYEQEMAMRYVTTNEQLAKVEGKAEEKATLALKMIQEGATFEFVMKVTGFTIAQLQELQAQSN
jgi:predicted transposase/invertase (TIGR01784 family)